MNAESTIVKPVLPKLVSSKQEKLSYYIRLGRFKFLVYSSLSYTFGTTFCLYVGFEKLSLTNYFLGLLAVWLIHLMTHYCNEYYDLEADKANLSFTKWTGGSRVLVDRLLRPKVSISIGYILLFTVLLLGTIPNKISTLVIGGGLFFGWFYTAPPFSFNYNKLGEISVAITLVFLVPLLGFVIQTGEIPFTMLVLLIPAFIIQFARMMIMNLSDYEGDVIVGKGTLVTFLKPKKTIIVYGFSHIVAYSLLVPFYILDYIPLIVLCVLILTIPISIWQYIRIKKGGYKNPKIANSIVFWASTHSALLVLATYLGIISDMFFNNHIVTSSITFLLCAIPPFLYLILMAIQIRENYD